MTVGPPAKSASCPSADAARAVAGADVVAAELVEGASGIRQLSARGGPKATQDRYDRVRCSHSPHPHGPA